MSKKPQQKQSKKPKHQIVDQQNEPFLKALSKRVRNINKKLTEIADLQTRDNLKPQQIDKINRKDQLIEERTKLEENSELFKQTYQDVADQYRQMYLKELENLAKVVTIHQAFPQFEGIKQLAPVWNGLSNINGNTLGSAVSNLTKVLTETANDWKLQKSINNFYNEKVEAHIEEIEPVRGTKVEVHTDQVIVYHEETVNSKGEKEEVEIVEKVHDGVVESVTIEVCHENKAIKEEQTKENPAPPPTPTDIPKVEDKVEEKKEEGAKPRKYDRPNRNNRDNREQRAPREYRENDRQDNRRGDGRPNYREGAGEKRAYRPKYEPKEDKKQQQEVESSDSQADAKVFRLKRDQIDKLEEQGFTVVGKPKPKARDQQAFHQHQHGKKYRNPHN